MSWNEDKINLFKKELKKLEKISAWLKDILWGNHLSETLELHRQIAIKWNENPEYKNSDEFKADYKKYELAKKKAAMSLDKNDMLLQEYIEKESKITDIKNELYYLEKRTS